MPRSELREARGVRAIVRACGLPAALATWALWLAVGLGRLGRQFWIFDLFANFAMQYLALFALCVVALTVARWRKTAIVALLGVAFTTATLAPYFPERADPAPHEEGRIRLVTFNVWYRNHDMEPVAEFLRTSGADVVVLQEVDPAQVDALAQRLPSLAYRAATPTSRRYRLAIFSRWPMKVEHMTLPAGITRISRASVERPGAPFVLFGAHLNWPLGAEKWAARATELEALAAAAREARAPVLAAGDFNLTPWSPHFRHFVARSGLTDCSIGRGSFGTWPAQFKPARIRIDHCFASRHWRIERIEAGPRLGSDHLPLIVDLALEDAAPAEAE